MGRRVLGFNEYSLGFLAFESYSCDWKIRVSDPPPWFLCNAFYSVFIYRVFVGLHVLENEVSLFASLDQYALMKLDEFEDKKRHFVWIVKKRTNKKDSKTLVKKKNKKNFV